MRPVDTLVLEVVEQLGNVSGAWMLASVGRTVLEDLNLLIDGVVLGSHEFQRDIFLLAITW